MGTAVMFTYHGVELDLEWLLSYGRVSTPQQTEKEGGGGMQRQREMFEAFAAWCKVPEDQSLGSLVDEGLSGRGRHLQPGGELRRIMDEIRAGRIKPKTGLVVESFSRLGRLHVDEALHVFTEIILSGTSLVSLTTQFAITQKSLRADSGVIYRVVSAILSARAESDDKVFYNTQNFRARRGTAANILPAWIVKTADGVPVKSVGGLKKTGVVLDMALDTDKQAHLEYVFRSALTMGGYRLCHKLNAEAVPVLSDRKRQRNTAIWTCGTLLKLLRGKQVLGIQETGHYKDDKRVVTGEHPHAYPAAISQELWDAVQVKMDARKIGRDPVTGRNVTAMPNIFGDLIRCQCGTRMKVQRRGKRGEYLYFQCSAVRDGGSCKNKQWHRIDQVERVVLPTIANEVVDTRPAVEDRAIEIEKQIVRSRADLAKTEQAYDACMRRSGVLAVQTLARLETEFEQKTETIKRLGRELAGLRATKPAEELQEQVRSLLDRALAGDVEARERIADALPGLVDRISVWRGGSYRILRGQFAWLWAANRRSPQGGEWQSAFGCRSRPFSRRLSP